jgi:hypothetical protein
MNMSIILSISTISAAQLVCHGIGDYALQSEWMAEQKTKRWTPAAVHAFVYSIPFVAVLHPSVTAWLVIVATHLLIDRLRLARYVCWARLWIAPSWIPEARPPPFSQCSETGHPPGTPEYMSLWLLVIVDNLMHVIINGWALATF